MDVPPGARWDLPQWREMIELVGPSDIYDVKFYPFGKPTEDPVFAAVGGKQLIVCRPTHAKDGRVETIQAVIDEEPNTENCSVAWAQAENGCPLLCIAGSTAIIKVINPITGELIKVFSGHGGGILDLAVPKTNPRVIASCSEDHTIRLWSLEERHRESPCVALFAGEGHMDTVLSIGFHASGRYLLSGGQDNIVNLWTVPNLPDGSTGEKAQLVHYPHFSTSEIHSNKVDCVAFYNDLILSRGHEEGYIVLWQIVKFSSTADVPSTLATPATFSQGARTRSAFYKVPEGNKTGPGLYQRLLQFETPHCNQWFMRFGLYSPISSSRNPVLAICNSTSKVFFWDLSRLVEYQKYITAPTQVSKPNWLGLKPRNKKTTDKSDKHRLFGHVPIDESIASSSVSSFNAEMLTATVDLETNRESWDEKYAAGNPWKSLKAHKVEVIPRVTSVGRGLAWSDNGDFCVVVGSSGIISVLERWARFTPKVKMET